MKKYLTGSNTFFKGIEGFTSKDVDYVQLVEPADADFDFVRVIRDNDKEHTFQVVKYSKEELINRFLQGTHLSAICFFLIPEIVNELGITIEDLHKLKPLRDRLNVHEYLGLIYDSYIKNNSFTLTDEQLQEAYANYRKWRTPKTKEELDKIREERRKQHFEKVRQRMLERQQRTNEVNQ